MLKSLRIVPAFAALSFTVILFGASTQAAFANRGAPEYRLTAEAPHTGNKVAGDVLWRCANSSCSAANATSRPAIVCAKAAREVGKLASFSYRGEQFDAEALAKCNTRAR